MNKSVLKNFAVDSRKELIEKIQIKAMQYGIEKDKIKNSQIKSSDSIVINGKPLSKEEKQQREKLIEKIRSINDEGGDGYKDVIEEVAYTWFNRFTALRFMEINNYLPTRVRVLSSSTPGNVEPELIKEASNVDLPVDKQKIYEMKLNNDIEGLFKYMIIAQCNALNISLPFMFEKIGHYTELLFPDGLLNEGAFIRRLTDIETILESDWEDVEIIGWLYQYYISEEKDRVIQAKNKYKKDEIPFATQLFTPDWIVRYMVQNTLGRYWIESHPEHSDLKKKWEFYLENPNPEPDFQEKLSPYINKELRVEDIKCFDPAMGSGHILVYMFDVLYEIYEKCGYMSREIPQLIIENNLYGIDIDDRAYQLACFSVIMKGMKYNNRLLRNIEREAERTGGEGIKLNLASIQETNQLDDGDIGYIAGEDSGEGYEKTKSLIDEFRNAKIYGSLINLKHFDEKYFKERLEYITSNPALDICQERSRKKAIDIFPGLFKQAKILSCIYNISVTNPPYMGTNYMNQQLMDFLKENYSDTKSDTFSAFIELCMKKTRKDGHLGFITPFVWMYITSYENLRKGLIEQCDISTLIELEYNSFPEACVPVCTFTFRNQKSDLAGEYIKLSDFPGSEVQKYKVLESIENPKVKYRHTCYTDKFKLIDGFPIAYWISEKLRNIFNSGVPLGSIAEPKQGMATGDNNRFLRFWHEVDINNIGFGKKSRAEAKESKSKWFPYNKGGEFRKWYGNNYYVVNFQNDGEEVKKNVLSRYPYLKTPDFVVKNQQFYFKKGITWSALSNSGFSMRFFDEGFIFADKGQCLFTKEEDYFYLGSLLNSSLIFEFLKMLAPTLDFHSGYIAKLPIIFPGDKKNISIIENITKDNIEIAKEDWDSFEISYGFKSHPILLCKKGNKTIEKAFENWDKVSTSRFYKVKGNDEILNNIFVNIYGVSGDIDLQVSEEEIRIRKSEKKRDIVSFISYAIGCMLGRYSIDYEGLIYAGGKFDYSKYRSINVDEDNILPILSDGYFEDDIVSRFVEFVKVTFGEELLSDNLDYIAETLGKKSCETAKDTIRRYFLTDFYKDHLQTYKSRPIYWMFTSGKQKAFNCLIYMHRYNKSTLSRIRTDYLHELQDRLDAERKSLVDVIEGDYTTKEKSEAKKELTSLDKQIDELKKYDEILHHMADMQIEIDLDDGVAVNYEKFKGLVAKI